MAYHEFAFVYDQLMREAPYDEWAAVTNHIIMEKGLPKSASILDLGCGTGEITLRLSAMGYRLSGVDFSSDMLAMAQHKAMSNHDHTRWVCQDIRELAGFSDMDAVVSYCDVMNYIVTKSDLSEVFQRVASSLTKQGLFIFDVHDETYGREQLSGHTFTDVDDAVTYIWECEQGEVEGRLVHDLTFFQQLSNGLYEKFSEVHEQQVYSLDVYQDLLKNAGFHKITFFNDFQTEKALSSKNRTRNFIIAEK